MSNSKRANGAPYTLCMMDEQRINGSAQTDARLGRAVAALATAREAGSKVSVLELVRAAGVDAADANRLVSGLRGMGIEVEGDSATGFRLVHEPDVALPELLESKIAGTIFAGGVRHFVSIGSTNAAAMRAGAEAELNSDQGKDPTQAEGVLEMSTQSTANAEARAATNATATTPPSAQKTSGRVGHPSHSLQMRGEVWVAEEQTAGKGRAGHVWKSEPKDGIYLSTLLRPRLAPVDVIILSLAAGLAVVEAVHEVTGLWGDLRWPNDVLMNGRKFCGILTELNAEVTRVRYVVVGMGLNVNNPEFPPELEAIATSLYREAGRKFSRVELVAALLRALDRELTELHKGVGTARDGILRRFEEHSSYCCGAAVAVEEDGGYEGVTRGLDERGFLRVEASDGMRTVLSGGVRKR